MSLVKYCLITVFTENLNPWFFEILCIYISALYLISISNNLGLILVRPTIDWMKLVRRSLFFSFWQHTRFKSPLRNLRALGHRLATPLQTQLCAALSMSWEDDYLQNQRDRNNILLVYSAWFYCVRQSNINLWVN